MVSTSATVEHTIVDGNRQINSSNGGERVFEHIQDLQAKAARGYSPTASIVQLMEIAERSLNQAQTLLGFRRPDLAFVEHLRALEILVDVIPRHRDYTHLKYDQAERANKLNHLVRRVSGATEQYANIKEIIKNNNARYGTRRSHEGNTNSDNGHINGTHSLSNGNFSSKVKPLTTPKPERLSGTPSSGVPDLNARFAQLRVGMSTTSPSASILPGGETALAQPIDKSHVSPAKPQGPRQMPSSTVANGSFSMPQEPKAIYNPARNMQVAGDIAPPRHSARSLVTLNPRRTSSIPNGPYLEGSNPGEIASPPTRPRRISSYVSKESTLSPQQLFDYLERFNILLIDFRSRTDYNEGHIFARNVICIEPFTLRQGMSADELQESLVVSPEQEQKLFLSRDRFDLVVYYDASSQSDAFLTRPTHQHDFQLRYLYEALCDFNQDKPLQRAPSLLQGGLEAWADLVGRQALTSSPVSTRTQPDRIISSMVGRDTRSFSYGRRAREYNPLGEEEEKNWRERARAESVLLPRPATPTDRQSLDNGSDDENSGVIREFLARFPEASKLSDRQFFAGTAPQRPAPTAPNSIPSYPSAPTPHEVPAIPARPAPTAPRMSYNGVSDRNSTLSSTVPLGRTVSGTPYVPAKYLAINLRLPRTGLYNYGATCYMNSTVQALSATTPLSVFFMSDSFHSQVQSENWRSMSRGLMVELYSNLIRSLWKGDANTIRPTTFRKFCGRAYQHFESDNVQQDAKEFLDFLLDCLHEDLNVHWSRTPLRELTVAEEAKRESMPKLVVSKLEWDRYLHRNLSFVQSLFGGQHLSQLTCKTCRFTSSVYEYFSSISVEIPSFPRQWRDGRGPSLEDCLRSYCTEETLSGDEAWHCPRCKVPRETTKRITITRVPQILIIHLKRFDNKGKTTSKIKTAVNFPLENLDLRPCVLPPPSPEEARLIASGYGEEYLKPEDPTTPPYLYDAFAVIRHLGETLKSGHYITAVKDRARQKWRLFNDDRVNDFDPQDLSGRDALQNDQAYILFYQRTQHASTTKI